MKHRFVPLNHVVIAGRCTHDPELRYTDKGVRCCDFQIAFNTYHDGKQKTHFLQIATFEELAVTAQTLRKGLPVVVEGELRDSKMRAAESGRWYSRPKVLANRVWRMTEDDVMDALETVRPAETKKRRTPRKGATEDDKV